jgi:hypothetical protein
MADRMSMASAYVTDNAVGTAVLLDRIVNGGQATRGILPTRSRGPWGTRCCGGGWASKVVGAPKALRLGPYRR